MSACGSYDAAVNAGCSHTDGMIAELRNLAQTLALTDFADRHEVDATVRETHGRLVALAGLVETADRRDLTRAEWERKRAVMLVGDTDCYAQRCCDHSLNEAMRRIADGDLLPYRPTTPTADGSTYAAGSDDPRPPSSVAAGAAPSGEAS